MEIRLNKIAVSLAVTFLTATSAVQGDILDGQTVTTTFAVYFPHGDRGPQSSLNSVVGPGTELTNFGFGPVLDIDLSDTNILITRRSNENNPYVYLSFGDAFGTIPRFTGVTLNPATNWTGFDSSRIHFNANLVGIDLSYFPFPDPAEVGQQISLDLTAMVPEPSCIALISLGSLGLFGFCLRRRENGSSSPAYCPCAQSSAILCLLVCFVLWPSVALGALTIFDNEAAFFGAANVVSTETFDEYPSNTFLGIVTAVVDGVTYTGIDPELNRPPPLGWFIGDNIFGPVSPPNELTYGPSRTQSLSFGDAMIAHAIGFFLLMPAGTLPPRDAKLTVILGDDTQVVAHALSTFNYRGFVAPEGIKSITIDTRTPLGASGYSFDNVSRSAIVPAVPEPSTLVVGLLGCLVLLALRRYRISGTRVRSMIYLAFLWTAVLTPADAATVTFTLMVRDSPYGDTFTVYAEASEGDNGGIAEYSFPIGGPVLTLDHLSPTAQMAQDASLQIGPAGFTASRSPDGDLHLAAGQDISNPLAHMVYGLGQAAGSFPDSGLTPIGTTEQPVWNKPLLIATGTHNEPDDFSDPVFAGGDWPTFAKVFVAPGSRETVNAQYITSVFRIPEPISVMLVGIAVIAITCSRRRTGFSSCF